MRKYVLSMIAVFAFANLGQAQTQTDFAELAKKLAPKIAEKIKAKQGDLNFEVGVFPAGNSDGKVTFEFYEPSQVLQGELIIELTKKAAGKFFVLDKGGLARKFRDAGISSAGITSGNRQQTAMLLKKAKIDAAVIGSIDAKSAKQVKADNLQKVNVSLVIIYQDGTADQITGSAEPDSVPPPDTHPSSRFRVDILWRKGQNNLVPLKLATSKKPNSRFHNVFFLEVPQEVPIGNKDKAQYVIRLKNFGGPPVRFKNPNAQKEKDRLFAAAVKVDGVNSIFQDQGNGKIGPVIVHPKNARKWVLSGPGKVIKPAAGGGFTLQPFNGKGHSIIQVPGFQKNANTAASFFFTKAEESVAAETIGVTNEVGVIEVHFYAQKLPGDQQVIGVPYAAPNLGTGAGPDRDNPTFTIKLELHPNPVEVWRIFYRKAGFLGNDGTVITNGN